MKRMPQVRRSAALVRRAWALLTALLFGLLGSGVARAETPAPAPPAGESFLPEYTGLSPLPGDSGWLGFSFDFVVKLAFVLLLVYVCLWLLRRFVGRGALPVARSSLTTILEQTHLAPNRSLYLIEVGDRVLLVGATAQQLNTLTEIADPVEVAALRATLQRNEGETFAGQLLALTEQITGRRAKPATDQARALDDAGPAEPGRGTSAPEEETAYLKEKAAELRRIAQHFGR